MTTHTSK